MSLTVGFLRDFCGARRVRVFLSIKFPSIFSHHKKYREILKIPLKIFPQQFPYLPPQQILSLFSHQHLR